VAKAVALVASTASVVIADTMARSLGISGLQFVAGFLAMLVGGNLAMTSGV